MISPFFDHDGRVVSLLGRIDSAEINLLADQLLRLDTENSDNITLYVSSVGGNLVDGLKIVDVMHALHAPVTAIAMGLVQAAGVLIFVAATERLILPSAMLSTANLWSLPDLEEAASSGFGSIGVSPREALKAHLETQVDKLSPASLSRMIRYAATSPRLFTAEEAIANRLADSIGPTRKPIDSPNSSLFPHVR